MPTTVSESFESRLAESAAVLGPRKATCLVAVSGGADSVALLRGLAAIAPAHSLSLVAAHLDHGLRGAASQADAEWVRQLCARLALPLVTETCAVRRIAAESGCGIEEAARRARYDFLKRAAAERGARFVAVAHTADDQVETALHHLFRGTGLEGLRGMPAMRELAPGISLVRPLLGLHRRDVIEYLQELGQEWREDVSNREEAFTRNWIRHRLLPVIRERYPQADDSMLRLVRQVGEAQAAVAAIAERLLTQARLDAAPDALRFDTERLAGWPAHIVREALRAAWRGQNWPLRDMTFEHWETLARLAQSGGSAVDLPGRVHAERRGGLLVLTRKTVPERVESDPAAG